MCLISFTRLWQEGWAAKAPGEWVLRRVLLPSSAAQTTAGGALGAGEQEGVLRDDGHPAPQRLQADGLRVDAVDVDAALVQLHTAVPLPGPPPPYRGGGSEKLSSSSGKGVAPGVRALK